MKVKTKLLSLACLPICATCLAPLSMASCGAGELNGRAFDLIKDYFPKTEKAKAAVLPIHTINEMYADKLKENPETFIEDYLWSKSWTGFAFEQFLFWEKLLPNKPEQISNEADKVIVASPKEIYNKDVEVISNLNVKFETATWNEVKWTFPILSFTLKYDSIIHDIVLQEYYFGEEQISGYINGTTSGTIEFFNVPFYVIPRTIRSEKLDVTTQVICFEPFYEWMAGKTSEDIPDEPVNPWKITTVTNSQVNGEISFNTGLTQRIADDWTLNVESDETNPEWKYADLSLEITIGRVFETPYYLSGLQVEEE